MLDSTAPVNRIGAGTARAVHTLFVPGELPRRTVWPPGRGHAGRAVAWALDRLGHGDLGGHVVVLAEHPGDVFAETLATVFAVDDAVAGGFDRDDRPTRLRTWLTGSPSRLRAVVAAVHAGQQP